jgi:phosphatidylserine decarboxylase
VIKTLPLRMLSRIWGYVHHCDLPVSLREPLYMAWTRAFDCHLEEMEFPLHEYRNLSEFFSRPLKADARYIDRTADLVSPADARLTAYGEINADGTIEQIKGMKYHVHDLLGFNPLLDDSVKRLQFSTTSALSAQHHHAPDMHVAGHVDSQVKEEHSMIGDESRDCMSVTDARRFYYAVLYLHPGDYHRYHSATECVFNVRRHFPGQLMPVAPSFAKWIPALFTRQERVVLSGAWKHGFFSYTPVGAYNVGGMKVRWDTALSTNITPAPHTYHNGCRIKEYTSSDSLNQTQYNGVYVERGDEIGHFELGSTIVLIFEVPANHDFIFAVSERMDKTIEKSIQRDLSILEPAGSRVKVGQPLGYVRPRQYNPRNDDDNIVG